MTQIQRILGTKTRRQEESGHGFTWRGLWPQPNPKHEIRNPKQIRITKTQNSKQTITSYFDGGYGSRIPISRIKNNKLKHCITDEHGLLGRLKKTGWLSILSRNHFAGLYSMGGLMIWNVVAWRGCLCFVQQILWITESS